MKKIKIKKNFLDFAEILWAWSKQLWRSDQTPSTRHSAETTAEPGGNTSILHSLFSEAQFSLDVFN